jgi:Ca2+/Na+ antiporter
MEKEKVKFKRPVTNKDLATFFMVMFFVFFFMFVGNSYTLNIILSIIMLILSVSFQTWHIIRELGDRLE